MSNSTVVLGSNHINTLGLIRSLGEAGYKPIAIIVDETGKSGWVSKSRYIKETHVVNRKESEIINTLIELGKGFQNKAYLFPAGDGYSSIIDNNYNDLKHYYFAPNIKDTQGKLSDYRSKQSMQDLAVKAGFSPILSKVFDGEQQSNIDEIIEVFSSAFPLIVRPDGSSKYTCNYSIIENEKDLKEVLHKARGKVLIQQYIFKDEELGIQGVSWGNATVMVGGVIHKIRTSLTSLGSTSFAELRKAISSDPIINVKRFIEMVGYSGIFDIELMRVGDHYYFIECNFRNGAYGYAYCKYGMNLPELWIKGSGADYDTNNTDTHKVLLMNEFNDIRFVLSKKINLFSWIKELFRTDVFLTWNKRDKAPFFYRLFRR